jgi:hypothetical protein
MRIEFEFPEDIGFEQYFGLAQKDPTKPFIASVDWLDDRLLTRINEQAERTGRPQIHGATHPGQAVGLPLAVEHELLALASSTATVVPESDPMRAIRNYESWRTSTGRADRIVDIAAGVRAWRIFPELVSKVLGAPLAECEAVLSHGLYEPGEMSDVLERKTQAREQQSVEEKARAEAREQFSREAVSILPKDTGHAVVVFDVGAPLPPEMSMYTLALVGVVGSSARNVSPQSSALTVKKKIFFVPAPPESTWIERKWDRARLLPPDERITVQRNEIPAIAQPGAWSQAFWSAVYRARLDIDRGPMGESIDLRDPRGYHASIQIRAYLRRMTGVERSVVPESKFGGAEDKRLWHFEKITRTWGSLTTDCMMSLLAAEDWPCDRDCIERFRQAGDCHSRGDYPDAPISDEQAWSAAVGELLDTNASPTSAEALTWCTSRGLSAPDAPRRIAGALKSTGRVAKLVTEGEKRVRRWLLAA